MVARLPELAAAGGSPWPGRRRPSSGPSVIAEGMRYRRLRYCGSERLRGLVVTAFECVERLHGEGKLAGQRLMGDAAENRTGVRRDRLRAGSDHRTAVARQGARTLG
jgi:hypothetical protein